MPSTTPASEFAGPEFTTDALYGLRNWKILDGEMHSVAKPYIWHPGINIAECHSRGCPCGGCTHSEKERATFTGGWPPEGHDIFSCKSRCGYYAYFAEDPNRQWSSHTNAVGVVKFTGRIFVGTKGLRGERAELVAVACPQEPPKRRDTIGYEEGTAGTSNVSWAHHQAYLHEVTRRFATVQVLPSIAARFGVPWFENVDQMLEEVPLTSASEFRESA